MSEDLASRTQDTLARDLRALGLASGDTVLVRGALRALGPLTSEPAGALIGALLDVVGQLGTILGLSHSPAGLPFDRTKLFRADSPCITGGLAAAMLAWPGAVRSRHPTNSMVAIGHDAERLLRDHDERSTCFGPIRSLVDAGGKMVLVGCIDSSPGFSTVHLAYEELGLAERSTLRGLQGAYYERDGRRRWFRKKDVPGCSMGFARFYPLYRERGVLRSGCVGDAASMLIGARDAYEIELAVLREDPTRGLCLDADCFSCRGTKLFNWRDMPRYYLTHPRRLPYLAIAAAAGNLVPR